MDESRIVEVNSIIVANIKSLCLERQINISQLEADLGFGNGSIGKWRTAKKVAPIERIGAIAKYFDVPASTIVGEKAYKDKVFPIPEVSDDNVTFPIIGSVAAGYDHIAYEAWEGDSIEIPRSYLHGRKPQDYFVLRVQGNSMYPDYQEGDYVLVLRQKTMDRSGQVGVVIYGDENSTLKRIEYVMGQDWMKLCPINPQYPPVTIRDEALEHCTVLGVAKMVIREIQQ